MTYEKVIRTDDIRIYMKYIGNADIIGGIPIYNNAGTTIGYVVKEVQWREVKTKTFRRQ